MEFRKSTFREYFESVAITAVIALFATTFVVQAFTENLFQYSKVAAMFWIMAAALVRLSEAAPERPAA